MTRRFPSFVRSITSIATTRASAFLIRGQACRKDFAVFSIRSFEAKNDSKVCRIFTTWPYFDGSTDLSSATTIPRSEAAGVVWIRLRNSSNSALIAACSLSSYLRITCSTSWMGLPFNFPSPRAPSNCALQAPQFRWESATQRYSVPIYRTYRVTETRQERLFLACEVHLAREGTVYYSVRAGCSGAFLLTRKSEPCRSRN